MKVSKERKLFNKLEKIGFLFAEALDFAAEIVNSKEKSEKDKPKKLSKKVVKKNGRKSKK